MILAQDPSNSKTRAVRKKDLRIAPSLGLLFLIVFAGAGISFRALGLEPTTPLVDYGRQSWMMEKRVAAKQRSCAGADGGWVCLAGNGSRVGTV